MLVVLNILTLNIWGIPFVSKDRRIRVRAISEELAKGDYDVVSLQEVWSNDDFEYIRTSTQNTFPYSHYFHSGVIGSGLCILSKFPIAMTLFHAWSVNGYVHRIQHGDWFGGKGVGLCKILVHDQEVNIYIAHLHAEYDRDSDDYKAHRVIQAFDTAQFIESTRSDSILQILAGDLNTEPGDLAYRLLLSTSKLSETCDNNLGTSDRKSNSYSSDSAKDSSTDGKRIDYILYRPGRNCQARVLEYKLPLSRYIPNHQLSYSDHEAVAARVQVNFSSNECSKENIDLHINDDFINSLQEGVDLCQENLLKLRSHKKIYLTLALVVITILCYLIDMVPPYGLQTMFTVFRVIVSGLILFFIIMATLWNSMEANGILSVPSIKNWKIIITNNIYSVLNMLIEISILSLNIWDIPFSSKNRKFRVVAICKEIVKGNYDVVLLQEIWSHSDLEYITNTTSNFFPFSHFFFSGVAGSGLAVLSKFPIIMTLFHAWRVNGYPHRIHHGDWFRGKGVGLCTIRVHNQEVNIYVAHLHAEYNTKYEDYKAHRVVQAFDTAQFIKSTRGNSVLQILAGDLKAEPDDLAYRLLLLPSKLIDVCDNSYGTSEYSTNSYASKKHLQNKERIDYIFYRSGNNYQAKVLKYELPFSHYIPNHQLHFSNHGAIACRIQVIKPSEKNEDLHDSGETCHSLREGVHVCEQHLKKIRSDKMYYLGMALVFATILFVCVDTNISYGFLIKKVNILFQKPTIRNVIKNSRIQNLINNPTIRSLFQILNFQQVYKPIQTLLRLIVSGLIIYFTFMATMWNSMEANGILSGKLAMETLLLNSHDL